MNGWSRNRRVWVALGPWMKSQKWTKVPFDPGKSYLVARGPGIYAICARPPFRGESAGPPGSFKPLYMGQAKRKHGGVQARFRDHTKRPKETVRALVECFHETIEFWYTVVEPTADLDALEAMCVEAFGPECNEIRAPTQRQLIATLSKPVPA